VYHPVQNIYDAVVARPYGGPPTSNPLRIEQSADIPEHVESENINLKLVPQHDVHTNLQQLHSRLLSIMRAARVFTLPRTVSNAKYLQYLVTIYRYTYSRHVIFGHKKVFFFCFKCELRKLSAKRS
jgi:hypothetical protein